MILEIPENCYRCKSMVREVTTNQINCQCKEPIITLFESYINKNSKCINKIEYSFEKYTYIFYLSIEEFFRDDGRYEKQDGWHQPDINNHETTLELIKKLEILRIFR